MHKAAIIGAGSTYTPELIEGFIDRAESLEFDNITLMDIDKDGLYLVGGLAKRQLTESGFGGEIILTESLDEALDGASFIFAQVRPGRMEGRIKDETIPLKYGLLGQETTGAGGFMQALRTVPVIMDFAEQIKKRSASEAWLINFSNPSGIIAEAVLNLTDLKMVGLCNCPINMIRGIADEIGTYDFEYEYVGLNHLSWITSVVPHGESGNIIASLIGKADTTMKNIQEIALDESVYRAVPYVASAYLNYYYARDAKIKKCLDAEKTRGEICLEIEAKLREKYADPNLRVKPKELEQRGGSLYSTAAVSAAESIACDKRDVHVVAAKNNGAVPFMDDSDAVEVKCRLGKNGIEPLPVTTYNEFVVGLMRAVKAYEKLAVRAALEGDRDIALAAMMAHPLIGDTERAVPCLEEMLLANKEHLPRFFS